MSCIPKHTYTQTEDAPTAAEVHDLFPYHAQALKKSLLVVGQTPVKTQSFKLHSRNNKNKRTQSNRMLLALPPEHTSSPCVRGLMPFSHDIWNRAIW